MPLTRSDYDMCAGLGGLTLASNPYVVFVPSMPSTKRHAEDPSEEYHSVKRHAVGRAVEHQRACYRSMQTILDMIEELSERARQPLAPVPNEPLTAMHTWMVGARNHWFEGYRPLLVEFRTHMTAFYSVDGLDAVGVAFASGLHRIEAILLEVNMADDSLFDLFMAMLAFGNRFNRAVRSGA